MVEEQGIIAFNYIFSRNNDDVGSLNQHKLESLNKEQRNKI